MSRDTAQSRAVLPGQGDPVAEAVTTAIRSGDVAGPTALLAGHPGLGPASPAGDRGTARTLLHMATDWPGEHQGVQLSGAPPTPSPSADPAICRST